MEAVLFLLEWTSDRVPTMKHGRWGVSPMWAISQAWKCVLLLPLWFRKVHRALNLVSSKVALYEYFFYSTLPNHLPYSPASVMLFRHSIFSLLLKCNSTLPLLVCKSPSSSGYTTQPLDSELVILASTLFVDDNSNSQSMVTFRVRWSGNYCMRIRLRVIADTSRLGRSWQNFLSNLPALGWFCPSDRLSTGGTLLISFF